MLQFTKLIRKIQERLTLEVEKKKKTAVHNKFLELPGSDPRRKAWLNAMKETSSFIRSYPIGRKQYTGIMNNEYRTMFAVWLGMNIPCIHGFVGQRIGGDNENILDAAGMKMMSVNLPGDHWRKRHDYLKLWLFQLMKRAKLDAQCELYDQFSRFINNTATAAGGKTQQEKYNGQERRAKQGKVPDLGATGRFTKELPGVGVNGFLGELKTLNGGKQYFETIANKDKNKRCVAVANRAKKIQDEYVKKLRDIDKEYNTVPATAAKNAIAAKPMVPETTDEFGRRVAAVPAVPAYQQ